MQVLLQIRAKGLFRDDKRDHCELATKVSEEGAYEGPRSSKKSSRMKKVASHMLDTCFSLRGSDMNIVEASVPSKKVRKRSSYKKSQAL